MIAIVPLPRQASAQSTKINATNSIDHVSAFRVRSDFNLKFQQKPS